MSLAFTNPSHQFCTHVVEAIIGGRIEPHVDPIISTSHLNAFLILFAGSVKAPKLFSEILEGSYWVQSELSILQTPSKRVFNTNIKGFFSSGIVLRMETPLS